MRVIVNGKEQPAKREPNHRLRNALVEAQLTIEQLAERADVEPKTVERWITTGRTPYPANMLKTAVALGVPESQLWPDAIAERRQHDWRASDRMRELMSWVGESAPVKEAEVRSDPERYRGPMPVEQPTPPRQWVDYRRGRSDGLEHTR